MRTDDLYLVDLIESCLGIESFCGGKDFPAFVHDEQLRSAVLWKLVVIAEASTKLSAAARDRFTAMPWEQIRGLRNRMIHGYFTLEWSKVWEIVAHDIPMMRKHAETILADQFPEVYQKLLDRRTCGPPREDA